VGNSAEGLVATGTRALESAGVGGAMAARSFAALCLEGNKEKIVDNLLNTELEKERHHWMDILLVVAEAGEIKRATQFPLML
jgi:hypothetical protein